MSISYKALVEFKTFTDLTVFLIFSSFEQKVITHICAFIPSGKMQGPLPPMRNGQGERYRGEWALRCCCISSFRPGISMRIKIKSHRLKIESMSRLWQQIPLHCMIHLNMASSAAAISSSWDFRISWHRFLTMVFSGGDRF